MNSVDQYDETLPLGERIIHKIDELSRENESLTKLIEKGGEDGRELLRRKIRTRNTISELLKQL